MARIEDVAKQLKPAAEEGVGWLLVWKTGKNWHGATVWPDYNENTCTMTMDREDIEIVLEAIDQDVNAILVNGYVHNLGVSNYRVSIRTLAENLRYHYKLQDYQARYAI